MSKPVMDGHAIATRALVLALLWGLTTSCTPEKLAAMQSTGASASLSRCTKDADGDGYGEGCALGADCDDGARQVTNECYRCSHHQPGCSCPKDGERVACGKVTDESGGKKTCGPGGQVCTAGTWSDCTLGGFADGHSGSIAAVSDATSGCGVAGAVGSACDPNCMYFHDAAAPVIGPGLQVVDGAITLAAGICSE